MCYSRKLFALYAVNVHAPFNILSSSLAGTLTSLFEKGLGSQTFNLAHAPSQWQKILDKLPDLEDCPT